MHIAHPLATAINILGIIGISLAGCIILGVIIALLVKRDPKTVVNIASPAFLAWLMIIITAVGFGIADRIQSADQLRAQSANRYGLNLTGDQTENLLDYEDRTNQTIHIDGKTATLLGTISINRTPVSLAQHGNIYLLADANQTTELPRR